MKKFTMKHRYFRNAEPIEFDEETAPSWLKGNGTKSTMDNRWFWDDYVMKLEVGESKETDFQIVTRVE